MHLQREAEVHSNSKQSGVEANFQGKKALGKYFFCCCSELKKSHEAVSQKNGCHALSLQKSISKPKGDRKGKKNNYTIHVQHAGFFFINIMSLFHNVFETVIVRCR